MSNIFIILGLGTILFIFVWLIIQQANKDAQKGGFDK